MSTDNCLIDPGIARFEGLLFQVGESRFLDLTPDRDVERKHTDACCLLPLNTIMKVGLNEKGLSLVPMKASWFEDQWRANKPTPRVLDTEIDTDREFVVLTAPPDELRTFLKEHENDPEMFVPTEMTRFVPYEKFLKESPK